MLRSKEGNRHLPANSNRAKVLVLKDPHKLNNKANKKVLEIAAILENKLQCHKGQVTPKNNNKAPTAAMAPQTKKREIRIRRTSQSELQKLKFEKAVSVL